MCAGDLSASYLIVLSQMFDSLVIKTDVNQVFTDVIALNVQLTARDTYDCKKIDGTCSGRDIYLIVTLTLAQSVFRFPV